MPTSEQVSASGSGHYREVNLKFKDADLSASKSMELVIRGVAGIEERVFRFELNNEMMR